MSRLIQSLIQKVFVFSLFLSGCNTIPRTVSDEHPFSASKPMTGISEQKSKTSQKSLDSYKVALLLPLSGDHQDLGHSLQQAAELSLFDHLNAPLELIFKDTHGKPEEAVRVVQEALHENVSLIIGPVFSYEVKSITPYLQNHSIPVFSLSNDQSVSRPLIYTLGFSPRDQIRQLVLFAASKGLKRIAALIPSNAYGNLIATELNKLAQDHQMTLVLLQSYTYRSQQILQNFKALENHSFDALILPAGGHELKLLTEILQSLHLNLQHIQLLGTSLWDAPETSGLVTLTGGWFISTDPEQQQHFENRFQRLYEKSPKKLSSLLYDALSIASYLCENKTTQPFQKTTLENVNNFLGIEGKFYLKPNGVTQRTGTIIEIQKSGNRKVIKQ